MELYALGMLPPDHIKQAMRDSGVPEEEMWDIREDLRKLEEPAHPPIEQKHRKKKKKVVPTSSEPPEIKWHGSLVVKGHPIRLEDLKDHKRAAAHDED
jgi:hypothetical protein